MFSKKELEAIQSFEFAEFANGDRVLSQDKSGNLTVMSYSEGQGGQLGPEKKVDFDLTDFLEIAEAVKNHMEIIKIFQN